MPNENENATCAGPGLGDRLLGVEKIVVRLDQQIEDLTNMIETRVEQEAHVQAAQRDALAAEIRGQLKGLESALRSHSGEQRFDEDKTSKSITRLHERFDQLMQKQERSHDSEFKAVHERINTVEADIKGLTKATFARIGATSALTGVVIIVLQALWSILRPLILHRLGI